MGRTSSHASFDGGEHEAQRAMTLDLVGSEFAAIVTKSSFFTSSRPIRCSDTSWTTSVFLELGLLFS